MALREIVVAEEGGERRLSFRDSLGGASQGLAPNEMLTLESLADLCDQQAESCNAHDFVMSHRALAALLFQEVGRKAATKIMMRISRYEGLPGMTGVCGMGDDKLASSELGVRTDGWHDWKLTKGGE